MKQPVRIANCSGFYGDRLSAAREMVLDGPIHFLTGDWLAELTMLILARTRAKRPGGGYARSFVDQMEQVAHAPAAQFDEKAGVFGVLEERGDVDAEPQRPSHLIDGLRVVRARRHSLAPARVPPAQCEQATHCCLPSVLW